MSHQTSLSFDERVIIAKRLIKDIPDSIPVIVIGVEILYLLFMKNTTYYWATSEIAKKIKTNKKVKSTNISFTIDGVEGQISNTSTMVNLYAKYLKDDGFLYTIATAK